MDIADVRLKGEGSSSSGSSLARKKYTLRCALFGVVHSVVCVYIPVYAGGGKRIGVHEVVMCRKRPPPAGVACVTRNVGLPAVTIISGCGLN